MRPPGGSIKEALDIDFGSTLSQGACVAASVRTFRIFRRLWGLPHPSRASMTETRVRSGWRGRERMKSRMRVSFIDSGVKSVLLRRCSATMVRKGGKAEASVQMSVGRILLSSLKFGSSLRQKKAPARCFPSSRVAQIE